MQEVTRWKRKNKQDLLADSAKRCLFSLDVSRFSYALFAIDGEHLRHTPLARAREKQAAGDEQA